MTTTSRFIAPYLNWFRKTTDAPVAYGEAGALMCLSTIALGKRWLVGTDRLHPNLFIMAVGPSSVARKSTAVKRARKIIEEVAPELVGPTDYTMEALFERLTKKDPSTGKPLQKMALFANEFGAELARSKAYVPTFQADLCALYDCDPIEKLRVGRSLRIARPRVSMFAACAYEMLKENMSPRDWSTGFLMRFIFISPGAPRVIRSQEPPPAPTELAEVIAALTLLRIDLGNGAGITFDPHASQLFDHATGFLGNLGGPSNHYVVHMYIERLRTTVRKLALLYQIDIDPDVPVSIEAVQYAMQFIQNVCWPGFIDAYQTTTIRDFESVVGVLLQDLRQAGPAGVMRSALTLKFNSSRVVNDVVDWVKKARLVGAQIVGTDERLFWRA